MLAALFPSVAVALLFWFVVRAMVQGDRRERAAMAELDRQERERAAREASRGTPREAPDLPPQ
ncbi:hypothetical protein SAMN05428996_0879 [Quadrisphaera sp. DSM 44207]|nr:hypothetical protein SAMN05428996_0879 [Quadrisphaera sp. DSM 44207]